MNQENNLEISPELARRRRIAEDNIRALNTFLHPFLVLIIFGIFSGTVERMVTIIYYDENNFELYQKALKIFGTIYYGIAYLMIIIRLIGVPLMVTKYKKKGEIDDKFSKKILSHYGVVAIIILLLFGSCLVIGHR